MTIDLVILDLVHQLLNLPDYGSIVTEVKDASDAELYINFMLYVRFFAFVLFLRRYLLPEATP
jgi:hypothetical protein